MLHFKTWTKFHITLQVSIPGKNDSGPLFSPHTSVKETAYAIFALQVEADLGTGDAESPHATYDISHHDPSS